jgi:hypothetical protein
MAEEIFSANTEQPLCILDCSGNTITVYPPHPIWDSGVDASGNTKTVILMDAVELGGQNGFYN